MDTEASEIVECPACGHLQVATIVRSANVARDPTVKSRLLDGSFMRHPCGRCACVLEIERDVLWTDFSALLMVRCFVPTEAADPDRCEEEAIAMFRAAAWDDCPPVVRELGARMSLRVVFGYDELREKVVCRDAGLDDKIVEFLKLAVVAAHPEWHRPGFVGLRLIEVRAETLVFVHEVDGPKPLVEVARRMYVEIAAQPEPYVAWAPRIWEGPWVSARSVRHRGRDREVGGHVAHRPEQVGDVRPSGAPGSS